ncbi:DUF3313 domain-containing protein [Paucibacter sp. TC2R-5]|uniref:DUF3313 domain-containing protein n=1 Tax=Paucibacter sp. TC2R-5 TaxID=2893555 RepID=UPI0021E3BC70|nr:DUF3313 domain-containing protein [Paucibacter sp. TC2R-5]MCV2359707.1 DUF3313 domain-containing protein [Paucibacter sp. TC2R-5]
MRQFHLNFPKFFSLTLCLMMVAAPLQAGAASRADSKAAVKEQLSHDGLEQRKSKDADLVYARPGASLAGYSKVMLGPVDVAFSKNWDPKRPGSNFRITAEEREEIRSGVANLVRDEFVKALQAKEGYQVVDTAGPDVLKLKVSIIELYVNAPDVATAARTKTYVTSAGEMTLFLEAFDSETGQVLARVVDRQESNIRGGQLSWTNRVMNQSEGELIASGWARKLRKALDKAHAVGKQ